MASCCGGNGTHVVDGPRVKDPVCGMMVDPATSAHHAEHDGHDFAFCCGGCRSKFLIDPASYLAGAPSVGGSAKGAAEPAESSK